MQPAAFDLTVPCLALHHIADYTTVVRRAVDSLKSGGGLVFFRGTCRLYRQPDGLVTR